MEYVLSSSVVSTRHKYLPNIDPPSTPSQPLSTPFHSLQRGVWRRDEDTQIAFALTAASASTSSIFVLGCVSRRRLADRQLKSAYSFAVRCEARTVLLPNCYNRGFAYELAWRMIVFQTPLSIRVGRKPRILMINYFTAYFLSPLVLVCRDEVRVAKSVGWQRLARILDRIGKWKRRRRTLPSYATARHVHYAYHSNNGTAVVC